MLFVALLKMRGKVTSAFIEATQKTCQKRSTGTLEASQAEYTEREP